MPIPPARRKTLPTFISPPPTCYATCPLARHPFGMGEFSMSGLLSIQRMDANERQPANKITRAPTTQQQNQGDASM